MKRIRSKKKASKLKPKHGPMSYFLTIAALVVVSAYSHIQFRADVQDQAFRAIASDQKLQFSQLNEEDAAILSAPEHLKGISVEAKKGKKSISRGDPR